MSLTYGQRRSMAKRSTAKVNREMAAFRAEMAAVEAKAYADLKASIEAEREANKHAHRDIASLKPGDLVRTKYGWKRVEKANAKSVTVLTGYSWTDRIAHEMILETRAS